MKNKKSFFTPPFLIQGDRKVPKTFILLIYFIDLSKDLC